MDTKNVEYIIRVLKNDVNNNYVLMRELSDARIDDPKFVRFRERRFPNHTDEEIQTLHNEACKKLQDGLFALLDISSTYKVKLTIYEGLKEQLFGVFGE